MPSEIRRIRVVGSETAATRTVLDGLSAFETERVPSVASLAQRRGGAVVLVAPAVRRTPDSAVRAVRRIHGAEPVVIAADDVPDTAVDAVLPLDSEVIGQRMENLLEETATERARQRVRSLEALATATISASPSVLDADGQVSAGTLCRRLAESGLYRSVWVVETDGSTTVPVSAAGVPRTALRTTDVDAETPWTRAIRTGDAVVDNEGTPTAAVPFDGGCLVATASEPIDAGETEQLSELVDILESSAGERRPRYALLGEAVSHEINNHLDLAMVHLELLEEDTEHVDHIEDALERIESVTDEVGALVSQDVDIGPQSLEAIAKEVWDGASTSDATLRGNEVTIDADERLLRLLLSNLFRNAVEHGGEDVTVEVGPLDSGGFYVADNGVGFPDTDPDRLFEWGWSGGDSTGIGLALVELAADQHGWEIDAADADGARFEFRP